MTYLYPEKHLTSRSEVRSLAEQHDVVDLSNISFVSRAAAHELKSNPDISYVKSDKVDERMEMKHSGYE